jgi:sulfopyruvate decarboxylase subunit alpha
MAEIKPEAIDRSRAFLDLLASRGYDFFTGVPCSLLGGLFRVAEDDPRRDYVSATREDCAVGMAAGAWFAGRKAVVMMQNSGLGVSINALASLNEIYEIPCLVVVSWRGQGGKDAPEHLRMGATTQELLSTLEIPWAVADGGESLEVLVDRLEAAMEKTRRPAALIVPKGVFA